MTRNLSDTNDYFVNLKDKITENNILKYVNEYIISWTLFD